MKAKETKTAENAVQAYFDRAAGSVAGGRPLSGTSASYVDPIPANIIASGHVDLEVFVVDNGGNITRRRAVP